MGCQVFIILLGGWDPTSSPTNFKLTWKTATLLILVIANYFSDLTLLHIDNQHLFLQNHTAFFFPHLVVRHQLDIFHLKFILNLIPVLIFALYFI